MTSAPPPPPPPPPTSARDLPDAARVGSADDWSHRWGDDGAAGHGAVAPPSSAVSGEGRRPRITHLVLVDGLPADHWVEDGSDGRWESRLRRRGGPARSTDHDHGERELRWLEALVGGRQALLDLDDRPLVAGPLDLAAAAVADVDGLDQRPPQTQLRARAISAECDRLALEVFGSEELVTALRHLLEAALVADPGMLDRSSRDDTATGALVWAGGHANGLVGPEGQLLARDLWPRLGVPPSAAGRGAAMLERLAPGADLLLAPPGAPRLRATGRPGALLGATRALLVARRDEVLGTPSR